MTTQRPTLATLLRYLELTGETFRAAEPPAGTPAHDAWRDGMGRMRTVYAVAREAQQGGRDREGGSR